MMKRLIFVALCLLMVTLLAVNTYCSPALAIVTNVSGPVWLIRAAKTQPLVKGMELNVNDTVKTGQQGSVELKFYDRHLVKLDPNTQIRISRINQEKKKEAISLYLDIGQLWVNVWTSFWSGLGFEVETQAGIAGVRGTKFSVAVDKAGKMDVAVEEGKVQLTGKYDGKSVELSRGTISLGNTPWFTVATSKEQ